MRPRDRISLIWLAITGQVDDPRWLRERDAARAEVDRYRRAANLRLGEFLGSHVTIGRIEARLRKSAGRVAPS